MKQYDTDWAKAESREIVGSMLDRTLLRFRKPTDIRVACFPGVNAQEVSDVYIPRGIPGANITGFERDADIASRIEELELGINVRPLPVEEWLASQDRVSFDVFSVDYIGPLNSKELSMISSLLGKQTQDHFVLHVSNLLRRDNKSEQEYAYGLVTLSEGDAQHTEEYFKDLNSLKNTLKNLEHVNSIHDSGGFSQEDKSMAFSSRLNTEITSTDNSAFSQVYKFIFGSTADAQLKVIKGINSMYFPNLSQIRFWNNKSWKSNSFINN